MSVVITGLQARVKNSAAYAEELGMMLVANGEELPYLLTAQGEKIEAGIPAPTVAPTIADNGSGALTNGKFFAVQIVYVSENTFPLVGAKLQSNPSPTSTVYEITGSGDRQVTIGFHGTDDPLVNFVYVYRTDLLATADLATIAAQAGNLNFLGKVANANTGLTLNDNTVTVIGNDVIELSNFTVPQFRFVVWDGSYFWGFGNQAFNAAATWETDGTFTLTNPDDKFYGGRDNQFITFDSIKIGGIDNRGTYLFKQTGTNTGKVILEDGSDATLPTTTTGNIVIIGQTANLYRSAYRNPFSWGYLQNIAGIYVPTLWEVKISGSLGTAIAIIPDQQLLKLDMEFPALCLTFSLQSAGTDVFQSTRRQVSRLHSVTSHFSQFNAISQGRQVLWGFDFKNLAIVECDGYTQVPVSGPISILLRQLSKNRSLHLLCHGIYDPVTEINAIWLSSQDVDSGVSPTTFDLCVYQHAPTGFWGVFKDFGILSSAAVEDPVTSQRNTLVGTTNGFVGKAFDIATYGNWLPSDSICQGYINSATATTITRSEGQDDFNPLDAGLIGNFVLLVDTKGLSSQIVQITGATNDTLSFAQTLNPLPISTNDPGMVPEEPQWQFFIGLIEMRVLKYMDGGVPALDKAPREYWATLENAEQPRVEYFPEHTSIPTQSVPLLQDAELDAWKNKLDFPTEKGKTFGLQLVERSFQPTRFFNFTFK